MMYSILEDRITLLEYDNGFRLPGSQYQICPICESHLVKATSVIFLLGVGSFVCYKLYSHYRRKLSSPPPRKRLRLLRWGSEELIESNTDLDSDLQNIETKYFGPEETNTEDVTEYSEDDVDECSSLLESASVRSDDVDDAHSELTDSDVAMGNFISSQFDSRSYSVNAGINYPDDIFSGNVSTSPVQPNSKNVTIPAKPRHHGRSRFSLRNLVKRRKDAAESNDVGTTVHFVKDATNDECDNGGKTSWNGSEADIESLGSPSFTNNDSDLDDVLEKQQLWSNADTDSASLNANFSPLSLHERSSSIYDRLPPDGADSQLMHNSVSREGFGDPQNPTKISDKESSYNLKLPTEVFGSREDSKGRLVRDHSFDSDASEISLGIRENIGGNTLAFLDNLLNNVHTVKQSCLNLDSVIVNLKEVGSPVKSGGSDLSESSMGPPVTDEAFLQKFQTPFKGISTQTAFISDMSLKSTEPSLMEAASNQACVLASTDISLEWESPVVKDSMEKNDAKVDNQLALSAAVVAVDSGSDFGTPLTSESPELRPSSSSASLEWDNEDLCADDVEDTAVNSSCQVLDDECGHTLRLTLRSHEPHIDVKTLTESDSNEPVCNLKRPNRLTPSISMERVVPGQSRECSPGDVLSCSKKSFECIDIIETLTTSTSSQELPEESLQTVDVPASGPMWVSSESGFGDEKVPTKKKNKNGKNSKSEVKRRKKAEAKQKKANRDSAYCEDGDLNVSRFQENISDKFDIIQYSETEWRGHTPRAATIREGYSVIPSTLGCSHLRRIRGDNYCAIRAAVFQVLCHNLPVLKKYGGLMKIQQKLENWIDGKYSWLQEWSFANRLPYSKNTCLLGFQECLGSLDKLVSTVSLKDDREKFLVNHLNTNPDVDVQLMEAVKLLMMVDSIEHFEGMSAGRDVPIFAILLFARETSDTPRSFMTNHLNSMGDSGGLEQIEMYLLGDTLGVTLRVVRPSLHGKEDYLCCYPDEPLTDCPVVNLVAEDDRHYNIIVS